MMCLLCFDQRQGKAGFLKINPFFKVRFDRDKISGHMSFCEALLPEEVCSNYDRFAFIFYVSQHLSVVNSCMTVVAHLVWWR